MTDQKLKNIFSLFNKHKFNCDIIFATHNPKVIDGLKRIRIPRIDWGKTSNMLILDDYRALINPKEKK